VLELFGDNFNGLLVPGLFARIIFGAFARGAYACRPGRHIVGRVAGTRRVVARHIRAKQCRLQVQMAVFQMQSGVVALAQVNAVHHVDGAAHADDLGVHRAVGVHLVHVKDAVGVPDAAPGALRVQ